MQIIIESEDEMRAFGAKLAGEIKRGDVIALKGALGVGKSSLARAVIRSVLGDENAEVPSPSFTLMQHYQAEEHEGGLEIVHIDLYRLGSVDELIELGIPEIFETSVALIEWPERLGTFLPDRRIEIEIMDLGAEKRKIEITKKGGADG